MGRVFRLLLLQGKGTTARASQHFQLIWCNCIRSPATTRNPHCRPHPHCHFHPHTGQLQQGGGGWAACAAGGRSGGCLCYWLGRGAWSLTSLPSTACAHAGKRFASGRADARDLLHSTFTHPCSLLTHGSPRPAPFAAQCDSGLTLQEVQRHVEEAGAATVKWVRDGVGALTSCLHALAGRMRTVGGCASRCHGLCSCSWKVPLG